MPRFEQIHQAKEEAGRTAAIALHGIAARIADRRLGRSLDTAERMEHKDRLYAELGYLARSGVQGTEMPETLVERLVDWRMDRRARKMIEKDTLHHIEHKTYARVPPVASPGGKPVYFPAGTTTPLTATHRTLPEPRYLRQPSTSQALLESTLDKTLPGYKKSVRVHDSLIANFIDVFVGPKLPGRTRFNKKLVRTQNNYEFVTGKKTARQRRIESLEIGGTRLKYGNKDVRRARRAQRHADESFERIEEMPISSTWRQRRLRRAEKRVRKHQARVDKHRDAVKALKK